MVLGVTHPVCADIARIADGEKMVIRSGSERVDDFKRRGLLAVQPVRINGIDQGNRRLLRH